jgi:hypothetical protein
MKYFTKRAEVIVEEPIQPNILTRALSFPARVLSRLTLWDRKMGRLGKEIDIDVKDVAAAADKYIPKDEKVYVETGGSPVLKQMRRAWRGEGTMANQPILRHLITTPMVGVSAALSKLTGGSYYSPGSNTVVVQDNARSVLAHELGHAVDFTNRKQPYLYGVGNALAFNLPAEFKATSSVHKYLKKEDMEEARELLVPALGTYLSKPLSIIPGGGIAAIIGSHMQKQEPGPARILNLRNKDAKQK